MSGLIVRAGDTLFVPLNSDVHADREDRAVMQRLLQDEMPGVKVIICMGVAGGPYVYRPEPTS